MVLNFNIIFALSLLTPIVIILHYLIFIRSKIGSDPAYGRTHFRYLLYVSPFHVWFSFFTSLPHKEERFLFVVYPVCCLAAAVTLEYSLQIVDYIFYGSNIIEDKSTKNRSFDIVTLPEPILRRSIFTRIIAVLIIITAVIVSLSRTISVISNYRAPLDVYAKLSEHIAANEPANKQINVCVGKEWYRFPSNFFMPRDGVQLRFLRTDFRGLLPKPFQQGADATSAIPTTMNDENREEMDRYVDISKCHYVVDLDLEDQREEHYIEDTNTWSIVAEEPFLDAAHSPTLARAFYIPGYSEERNVYGHYVALHRISTNK
jgi:alpha-1,2-mannosyltransferase